MSSNILAHLKSMAAAPSSVPRPSAQGQYTTVSNSSELERIMALPRRPIPTEDEQARYAEIMTARLRRENPKCECARLRPEVVARGQNPCLTHFRPAQGWYLYELAALHGATGMVEVGGGKTALDIFSVMVLPPRADAAGKPVPLLAVLLISPSGIDQFLHDFKCWAQHFRVPNLRGGPGPWYSDGRPSLEIFPYSHMPLQKNATWLKQHKPDLIIADEAQMLKAREATRTSRFLRYFADSEEEGREVMFCCHSGSLTTRQVQDFAHLLALSLRDGSPLPLKPEIVDEWGDALNPTGVFMAGAGALMKLREGNETIRHAVHRRLVETPGIIATRGVSVDAKLVFREAPATMPARIKDLMAGVAQDEMRPDGEVLVDQLEVSACLAQLACGFYYHFAFPNDEPAALIDEWFDKRKAWNKELRVRLQHRSDNLDSPALVRDAAIRWHAGYDWTDEAGRAFRIPPKTKNGPLHTWDAEDWLPWAEIMDKVKPVTRVKWEDDFLARAAVEWARKEPGIIWYDLDAFGTKVAQLGKFTRYGGGKQASIDIRAERGDRTIVASLDAHHKEKNLQAFYRNLFTTPFADGGMWEQALGRTYRYGQPRELVEVYVFRHAAPHCNSLDRAREFAGYAQELTGNSQRLLLADYEFDLPDVG